MNTVEYMLNPQIEGFNNNADRDAEGNIGVVGGSPSGQNCDGAVGGSPSGQKCDGAVGGSPSGQNCDGAVGGSPSGQNCDTLQRNSGPRLRDYQNAFDNINEAPKDNDSENTEKNNEEGGEDNGD